MDFWLLRLAAAMRVTFAHPSVASESAARLSLGVSHAPRDEGHVKREPVRSTAPEGRS